MKKELWEKKHTQYSLNIRFKPSGKLRIPSEGCYKCQFQRHRNKGLKVQVGQACGVHEDWKWWEKNV